MKVGRLFLKGPRFKCSKFKYKEDGDNEANILGYKKTLQRLAEKNKKIAQLVAEDSKN